MLYRILKKTKGTETAYLVQWKIPFLPIWLTVKENYGLFTLIAQYSELRDAEARIDELVDRRDRVEDETFEEVLEVK